MEPRIQYAKTADGVSIAFWTLGEGVPIVHMTIGVFGHIQLEWQYPPLRDWYEGLASRRRVIRYDPRGMGLSQRKLAGCPPNAPVLDLEAVVEPLDLEPFILFAPWTYLAEERLDGAVESGGSSTVRNGGGPSWTCRGRSSPSTALCSRFAPRRGSRGFPPE